MATKGVQIHMGGTTFTARSYRIKVIRIPRRDLLHWFFRRGQEWPDFVSLPVCVNIPEGSQILQCQFDDLHMSLLYIVEHPSFPEVPDGEKPPVEDVQYMVFRIQANQERPPGANDQTHGNAPPYPEFPIVHSLYKEVLYLRGVMDDLRQDNLPSSDVVDQAYRAGFQKGISRVLHEIPPCFNNFIYTAVSASLMIERLQNCISDMTVDGVKGEEKT